MPKIAILCPYHGVREDLEIPDSYAGFSGVEFKGDIPCGNTRGPNHRAILTVKIANSQVTHISVSREPVVTQMRQIEDPSNRFGFFG